MKNNHLKILLAAPRGFCAGVDRAIEIVKKSIDKYGAPVYVRHEIVHNKHVVDSLKKIGAVFANQLGTYYDMWTLRDDEYCQNDFWAETLQNIVKKIGPKDNISIDILTEVKKNFIDKKTYSFDKNLSPLKVHSAVGGFGIYKMKYVILCL